MTIAWLLVSLFSALPYYFAGSVPTMIDAYFEAMSGFTTTGATVIASVEQQPQSILLWRALTHWLGGMGIIVYLLLFSHACGLVAPYWYRRRHRGL